MSELITEAFPLIAVMALTAISLVVILRKNGHSTETSQVAGAYQTLIDDLRRERDQYREAYELMGAQMRTMGIQPASLDAMETLSRLARDIEQQFSMDEMDALAFDVGIKPEHITGDTTESKARNLVMAADRRHKLERLVREVTAQRPPNGGART